MRYVRRVALCMIVLAAGHAMAQKPDSARARLAFLVGSYTTETTMPKGPGAPDGAIGKGTSAITWALDSMFLVIEEESLNSLFGKYYGHGMLGYDQPGHEYVLSMFNNFGDHPVYTGEFSGDTLVLRTKVTMPAHPFYQKLLWYKDGESIKLRVLNDSGKGFTIVSEQRSIPLTMGKK